MSAVFSGFIHEGVGGCLDECAWTLVSRGREECWLTQWWGDRYVQTDMGNGTAKLFGMEKAFQELDPTVEGMVKVVSVFLSGAEGLAKKWIRSMAQ